MHRQKLVMEIDDERIKPLENLGHGSTSGQHEHAKVE